MTFSTDRLVTTPTFARRFSSVFFLNSATKINFVRVSRLYGVIRGGPTFPAP